MKYNVKPEYKKLLVKIITKNVPTCKIYLFGSRARKTNDPSSDIDIALESQKNIPFNVIGNIKEEIEESKIPFFVDILDFNSISNEMKKEISKDKILWNN